MQYILQYTKRARDALKRLGQVEARRIVDKLEYYCGLSNPFLDSKALEGGFAGLYRFRIGKYRVIFSKNQADEYMILLILKVGRREDIYKD